MKDNARITETTSFSHREEDQIISIKDAPGVIFTDTSAIPLGADVNIVGTCCSGCQGSCN